MARVQGSSLITRAIISIGRGEQGMFTPQKEMFLKYSLIQRSTFFLDMQLNISHGKVYLYEYKLPTA